MSKDDLSRKNLDDASFAGSDLSDTELSHTSLRRSQLQGANLQRAELAGADLHGAQLDGADLTGANLRDADLTGASLHGVDLERAASTEGARLSGARGLGEAGLPDRDDDGPRVHLAQATADILSLTRDIAEAARAALDPAEPPDTPDAAPGAVDQHVVARIVTLQARRNLLEDRILSLLEEQTARRPAAARHDW
jgi:uncharacterized protein YjbI with pentapeptide repeats